MAFNATYLIGIALWALIPGFIAKKKGRSFAAYFFLSFLITPLITIIVTLCVKNLNDAAVDVSSLVGSRNTVSHEPKWLCKCGVENVNSLSRCPYCNRTREEVEGTRAVSFERDAKM